ncbi:ABC transporter substrate-binding protein [Thalassococcus sp. BH17M4-6]|uniref:ABC transporter substrate-binding protein n=1 Tax=Thalassococcus sp. BH17M4-6 TaxID=3413148 RepID=UPI003BCF701F
MFSLKSIIAGVLGLCLTTGAAQAVEVRIAYLKLSVGPPPNLSELEVPPVDLGLAGAALAIDENATTGRFLGQSYAMEAVTVPEGGDWTAAVDAAIATTDLLLVDAPKNAVLAAADRADAKGALLFNVAAPDVALRDGDCRANLLHTIPSRAMLADALVQLLVQRRWRDLALVTGPYADDLAFAEAIEASVHKFGLEIGSRADWTLQADLRRSASTEVASLTQGLGAFDVLIVADEARDFGRYMLYNTWLPRPVVGSEGLVPSAWAPVIEQWGALQLQTRFRDQAGRDMRDEDYAAWAAVRAIGEAVTRTSKGDAASVRGYLLGDDFELAGFKGAPLTFRGWNGQLRQPIALAHPRGLAAQAPLDGFLHQTNPLDTLGLDITESECTAFR